MKNCLLFKGKSYNEKHPNQGMQAEPEADSDWLKVLPFWSGRLMPAVGLRKKP
jgi:hypothetical protein